MDRNTHRRATRREDQVCIESVERRTVHRTLVEWALVVLIAIGLLAAYLSFVQSPNGSATSSTQTVTVRVEQGDTIWSLARDYPLQGLNTAETAHLIASRNGISAASLAAGSVIEIPVDVHPLSTEVAHR